MPNIVEEFQKFQRSSLSKNPGSGESETTRFMQHLADDGTLREFTDGDWMKLGERLGLSDDEIGILIDGTSSWIVEEPTPPSEQEPADWPVERTTSGPQSGATRENPAPASRGISAKQGARRGSEAFDDLMDELEDEWDLDDETLDNIVEIRRADDSFEIRLKGIDSWELLEDDEEDSDDEDGVAGRDEDFDGAEEE